MPRIDRMNATAFAEGFVKECAARGVPAEQVEDMLKASQVIGAVSPWDLIGGAGRLYRGAKGVLGDVGESIGEAARGVRDWGKEYTQGALATVGELPGKAKYTFAGGDPNSYAGYTAKGPGATLVGDATSPTGKRLQMGAEAMGLKAIRDAQRPLGSTQQMATPNYDRFLQNYQRGRYGRYSSSINAAPTGERGQNWAHPRSGFSMGGYGRNRSSFSFGAPKPTSPAAPSN